MNPIDALVIRLGAYIAVLEQQVKQQAETITRLQREVFEAEEARDAAKVK